MRWPAAVRVYDLASGQEIHTYAGCPKSACLFLRSRRQVSRGRELSLCVVRFPVCLLRDGIRRWAVGRARRLLRPAFAAPCTQSCPVPNTGIVSTRWFSNKVRALREKEAAAARGKPPPWRRSPPMASHKTGKKPPTFCGLAVLILLEPAI